MYFTYFNFISDQPGPPPARIREGAEPVRCREKEEPGGPPRHCWPGPLVHTAGIGRAALFGFARGKQEGAPSGFGCGVVHSCRQGGGWWRCPLLCCQGPLEGASPGLQVDGRDVCGSAGLAGPLATRAPGGFGCRAGRGLGGFSEALPERSFNLLLTGPQAVLQTRGNGEE